MFLDETGCLLIPTVRRTWAPRGQTPFLRHRCRRDRISVISSITLSPRRRRLGLYWRYHTTNIASLQVCAFLRYLLRHVHGDLVLLWDENPTHKSGITKGFLARHPRIHAEPFPGYAPELNPDEYVWTTLKRDVANAAPDDLSELGHLLTDSLFRLRRSQRLLASCVRASTLPAEDILK